jgi:hypothetical protein
LEVEKRLFQAEWIRANHRGKIDSELVGIQSCEAIRRIDTELYKWVLGKQLVGFALEVEEQGEPLGQGKYL